MYVSPLLAGLLQGWEIPAGRRRPFSSPAGLGLQLSSPAPVRGFLFPGVSSMAADDVALAGALKIEAAKVAPFGASLVMWGLTLQEWTLVFGCMYAVGLVIDLVVRRWAVPLWRHLRAPSEAPVCRDVEP